MEVHISMKYKIWNAQYKCNIIQTGKNSLLQLKSPHMRLQVILNSKTDDSNPTYNMLPWGWIVLHKINIPQWMRTGVYITRHGGLMKSLHVCPICSVWYPDSNKGKWVSESSPLEGYGWLGDLKAAWACQCGRWVWGRGRASSPCISSSCHYAAKGALFRQFPAAGGRRENGKWVCSCRLFSNYAHLLFEASLRVWENTYMFSEKVSMRGQHWIDVSDVLHDVLYCPQVGVLTTGPWAFAEAA